MAKLLTLHPENPQARLLNQAAATLHKGGIIVYPTDSCYALACHLEDKNAVDRIRKIRRLDKSHHMTLVCQNLQDLGNFAKLENSSFRLVKSLTPGPYTFLMVASRDVPRRLQHPSKKTIGLRVPANRIALELLSVFGEPILSTSLILPGEDIPLTDPFEIQEKIGNQVDLILDGGNGGIEETTVLDMVGDTIEVVRQGKGDVTWLL